MAALHPIHLLLVLVVVLMVFGPKKLPELAPVGDGAGEKSGGERATLGKFSLPRPRPKELARQFIVARKTHSGKQSGLHEYACLSRPSHDGDRAADEDQDGTPLSARLKREEALREETIRRAVNP